jgi:DNA-binding transcriptional LysR family regulator
VADEELLAGIDAPFEAINSAVERLNRYRAEPMGKIRLNVLEHASSLLLGPVLPIFVERYPEIEVEVTVTNQLVGVIARGADAGIRYGGTVPEDMIAQAPSGDMRWVFVGASGYLSHFGVTPRKPTARVTVPQLHQLVVTVVAGVYERNDLRS